MKNKEYYDPHELRFKYEIYLEARSKGRSDHRIGSTKSEQTPKISEKNEKNI
ncbi:MAG: hypothetical protein ACTSQY_00445 [Candidatus Odinarchaeia archaeon]|nr:MAG: hypothetical protein [Lokiarchaeota virus Fenrir Meg22_1012]URC17270.1 MAG: hypothetical protein [Lokiarchaeota virus Fenrir Meg22_1214]